MVAAFAALLYFREGSVERGEVKGHLEVKNPFSLIAAVKFAALFAVVLLAFKIVQQHFPPDGLYAVAALAGLTDVDAITLSMAEFAKSGRGLPGGDLYRDRGPLQYFGEMRHGLCRGRPCTRQTVADGHGRHTACRSRCCPSM